MCLSRTPRSKRMLGPIGYLRVADIDSAIDRAVSAGATVVIGAIDMPPVNLRFGIVSDPSVYQWGMVEEKLLNDDVKPSCSGLKPSCGGLKDLSKLLG